MTTHLDTGVRAGSGRFLVGDTTPDAVFTREDLSEEQLLFGRAAEEFMRTEVVPRAAEIYAKDWLLTRELIKKAADRDFTRLEIPEAYGGLGLDKVSTACVGEQLEPDAVVRRIARRPHQHRHAADRLLRQRRAARSDICRDWRMAS